MVRTQHLPPYTTLILAGGQGARMGGIDKGWQTFRGKPLIQHVLARLQQQTVPPHQIHIIANRHVAQYQALGHAVWSDAIPGFAGPLAGLWTGMMHCSTPILLTVPCDVPAVPHNLAEQLLSAIQHARVDIAVAAIQSDNGDLLPQPTFCALRTTLQADLRRYLDDGHRKVGVWQAQHGRILVPFDSANSRHQAFANINTTKDLQALEQSSLDLDSLF